MSECYIGEIRIFAGNYAPYEWALCDGQLLSIQQNYALYSLLGATYGGDGRITFALPDLRGRIPVSQGHSPCGDYHFLGKSGGTEEVTLLTSQMPEHTHPVKSQTHMGNSDNINNNYLAGAPIPIYSPATTGLTSMSSTAVSSAGENQPHANMMPFLSLNYIIALTGDYPKQY